MITFKETAEEYFGAKLTHNVFEEVGIPDMPEYVPYADEDQNKMAFFDLDKEITPEAGNKYVQTFVMHSYGWMMCGTVKACKYDCGSNPVGCRLVNLILDMCLYDLEFPDGEVTLLIANVLAQALYAQCNVDGNQYLLLECFVDV